MQLADPDWQSDTAVTESMLFILISEKLYLQLLKLSVKICAFTVQEGVKTVAPELLRLGIGAFPPLTEQKLVTELVTCPVTVTGMLKVIIYG